MHLKTIILVAVGWWQVATRGPVRKVLQSFTPHTMVSKVASGGMLLRARFLMLFRRKGQ